MKPSPEVIQFGVNAVAALDARMEQMQAEYAALQAERAAWTVILGPSDAQVALSLPDTEDKAAKDNINTGDMTVAARDIINGTNERGFKPKDVSAKLAAMGFTVSTGFSSNVLFRMKKKGLIVEHRGRYYLPTFDPRPRLSMAGKDQEATEVTS
jgi:hypothetical protein